MTRRIYLDTNILIATFESTSANSNWGWSVLRAIESGRLKAVTSELTLAEVLPRPIERGDAELVDIFEALLTTGPALDVLAVSRDVLVAAAGFRARDKSLKLPDAIHLATATLAGCALFLTNDLRLNLPATLKRVRLAPDSLRIIEGPET